MNVTTEQNMAKLAINKSLLKEYDVDNTRTVYMTNGNEFQIQLYNPSTDEIAAGIWINNEKLSNLLVIRPGERIWLERYLDKAKKFRFDTYEVEDNVETEKAISYNGVVKIEFYRKQQNYSYIVEPLITCFNDSNSLKCYSDNIYSAPTTASLGVCTNAATSNATLTACADSKLSLDDCKIRCSDISASIETGRVSEGSYSSQKFNQSNSQFSSWAFKTETIKILPESRKPYTSNDLEKIYCTECGRKLKTKYKFCPFCGTKIDY